MVLFIKNKKALESGDIPSKVPKQVFNYRPVLLVITFSACLAVHIFPSGWEFPRLLLINKGKSHPKVPSEYCPFRILETGGNSLEKLTEPRIADTIPAAEDFLPKQYGFTTGQPTIDTTEEMVRAVGLPETYRRHS